MQRRDIRSSSLDGENRAKAELPKRKRENQLQSSYDSEYSQGILSDKRGKSKLTAEESDQRKNQIVKHLEQSRQLKKQAKIEYNQVIMGNAFKEARYGGTPEQAHAYRQGLTLARRRGLIQAQIAHDISGITQGSIDFIEYNFQYHQPAGDGQTSTYDSYPSDGIASGHDQAAEGEASQKFTHNDFQDGSNKLEDKYINSISSKTQIAEARRELNRIVRLDDEKEIYQQLFNLTQQNDNPALLESAQAVINSWRLRNRKVKPQ